MESSLTADSGLSSPKVSQTTSTQVIVDYERGKFETLSPASSTGIVVKSPLKRQLIESDKNFKIRDKDLVDYDLHTGKSKMSKVSVRN